MTDGLKDKHRKAIIDILSANKRVERVVLFGSRAMGTFTPTSDVDIVLYGAELTPTDRSKLAVAIDELSMPQQVDLLLHKSIKKRELLEHIEKHGVEWWRRVRDMGSDWCTARIEEIAAREPRALAMGPFGSNIKTNNFVPVGVPVIRGQNLNAERFNDSGFVYLTENKANELAASNAFPGDLVFTHRRTLGQVGIIPYEKHA